MRIAGAEEHAPRWPQRRLIVVQSTMEFALALIMVARKAGLGEFTAETLARPDIRAAMGRIRLDAFDAAEPDFTNVTTLLVVSLRDGRRLELSAWTR